ncbi:hypothetical protein MMC30_002347 [Trapelia coarctata]|nr:hypothetical protein [Trapelia coarctata]
MSNSLFGSNSLQMVEGVESNSELAVYSPAKELPSFLTSCLLTIYQDSEALSQLYDPSDPGMTDQKRTADEPLGLPSMLCTGMYHDFTIHCKERTWKVHRAVLCADSKYFEVLCDGQFQEAVERTIHLHDDDPDCIGAMLQYIYYTNFTDILRPAGNDIDYGAVFDAKLYATADKYRVQTLKDAIEPSFTSRLSSVTERKNNPPMLILADLLAVVYETTPDTDRGLRDPLAAFINEHRSWFLARKSVTAYMQRNHAFSLDILNYFLTEAHSVEKFSSWCPICKVNTAQGHAGKCSKGHDLEDWAEPGVSISS